MDLGGNFPKEPFGAGAFASNGKRHGAASADMRIHGRGRRKVHAVRMDIFRYTDDLIPRTVSAKPNSLTKRAGRIAPILASHILGHQSDAALAEDIVPGEIAPSQ